MFLTEKLKGLGISVVEHLPAMGKALDSLSRTAKVLN
jgi:hypothetical protein